MKTVARPVLLAGVIALLGLVVPTALGGARVSPDPTADIQSVAGLAPDAQSVDVQVLASCPETARLESGGEEVLADVIVACPAGTNGLLASLVVSQAGQSIGSGAYVPICDGSQHTFTARVEASQGLYHLGSASEPVRKRSNVGAQAERSLLGGGRQSCEGPTGACHSWARSSQRWLLP